MIDAYTINGAWLMRQEVRVGSIEVCIIPDRVSGRFSGLQEAAGTHFDAFSTFFAFIEHKGEIHSRHGFFQFGETA